MRTRMHIVFGDVTEAHCDSTLAFGCQTSPVFGVIEFALLAMLVIVKAQQRSIPLASFECKSCRLDWIISGFLVIPSTCEWHESKKSNILVWVISDADSHLRNVTPSWTSCDLGHNKLLERINDRTKHRRSFEWNTPESDSVIFRYIYYRFGWKSIYRGQECILYLVIWPNSVVMRPLHFSVKHRQ